MQRVDSIPAPAVLLDRNGRVAEVNERASRLFERSAASLCGLLRARLLACLPDGEPPGEVELSDGSTLLVFSQDALVQRLRRQVYHDSRLASVGRLVSTVVHEINNALSGIVGYSQFLLFRDLDEEVRRDLERIHEESLRTSRVVQNLLRFSREGQQQKTPLQIAELLQRCAELKKRDFQLHSIEFELTAAAGLPPVLGNDALLLQVFLNLIGNAEQSIHAVREQGRIEVHVRRSRGQIQIDVVDDGPGIPADRQDRVFDPFFTTREPGVGTGLGLTLCREILHEHGASIRLVRRRQPGACFRLCFPIATEAEAPPSHRSRPRKMPAIRNRRIVVVEDEPAVRELTTRAFTGRGNRVITFERGEDALAFLQAETVDLVVSDIRRPGLDGIQLYQELARLRPGLQQRFLFVTGDTVSPSSTSFLERSRVPFLRKPVTIPELLAKASEILERDTGQGELFAEQGGDSTA